MRNKINIIVFLTLLLLLPALTCFAQEKKDSTLAGLEENLYSDAFLDTVRVERVFSLNDYSMFGIDYGASLNRMQFNPTKTQTNLFLPNTFSVFFMKYGKLFDGSPNFGFKIGARYSHEGYKFKENQETGLTPVIENATQAVFDVVEVPFMAHIHSDGLHFKVMADLGIYGGYRLNIERFGESVREEIRYDFLETDRRFDYGITGGVGFGFVFDPVEIHFNAAVRYSWGTIYDPDYFSKDFYRFGYPLDLIGTVGLYFHLSKRTGKSKADLRREARESVFNNQLQK